MRVVVFFLSLCFLLFSGSSHTNANTHSNNISYVRSQCDLKVSKITHTNTCKFYSIKKSINLDKENESIICDDVEDEDTDNFFVKKCKQQDRSCIIAYWHTYLSVLNYLSNTFKIALNVCGKVSHKYILQRVLRI
jgi:hypothetical protein